VNYFDCIEGEQELQNATYQGILHVLKEFPLDKAIIFIIDRKAAIDIMENLPKTQKKRQEAGYTNTNYRTTRKKNRKTLFNYCYSHTLKITKVKKII
jgi:hypothetical protein